MAKIKKVKKIATIINEKNNKAIDLFIDRKGNLYTRPTDDSCPFFGWEVPCPEADCSYWVYNKCWECSHPDGRLIEISGTDIVLWARKITPGQEIIL